MCWGCHYSFDEPSLASSDTSHLSSSITFAEERNTSSMIWTMVSGGTDCPNPSWQRTPCSFFLLHLSVTSTRPLSTDLTLRGSDSRPQVAYKRLSSGLSLYQPSESGHQGGMCWISIPVTMLTRMCSRQISDNAYNLWVWYCVLPQVALWGKGIL